MTTHVTFPLLSSDECAALVNEIDDCLGEDDPDDDYGRQRIRNVALSEYVVEKLRVLEDVKSFVGCDFHLNHFWFYTRYPPGGGLPGHYDGVTSCEDSVSVATLLIYLNDDFEGGHTAFLDGESVVPKTGLAVVLRQDAFHAGAPVASGIKYLLRTDVMRSLPKL
jgi:2OG-Fe(II) oxygenase superfamily